MSPRAKWFSMLADLTYPANPVQAAQAFKAYLPMLSSLPDGAFTTRSLEAVTTSPRKMAIPSYDEVYKPLAAWWRENRPFQVALPAPAIPDREPVTPEVAAVVSAVASEAVGILLQAINEKTNSGPNAVVKPRYISDGHRLLEAEDAMVRFADAIPGTQEGAFYELARMRRDGLRKKLGVDQPVAEPEYEHA